MIPAAMEGYKQFICWTLVDKGGKKPDKVPTDPLTGQYIDPHDPTVWIDSQTARQYAAMGYGVGFVFTKEDPFFFLDIDECLVNGQWSNIATHMCTVFAGCYVEVSHSGDGLHIFGSGTYADHGCRNKPLDMEFYTEGRFCALTGVSASGDATTVIQSQIDTLINTYFPATEQGAIGDWTTGPCEEWYGITDDEKMIKKMLKSKSTAAAFGSRATIKELWDADSVSLTQHYPDPSRGFDHSSADAALLSHLAFWTGKDCDRMDRLFRQSALMRDKWDRKEGTYGTYGNRSILRGCSQCTNVYGSDKKPAEQESLEPGTEITTGNIRDGFQYLTIDHQQKLFKGCCYVRDEHKIFTPDGSLLQEKQFKAMYGGYVFALDTINDKTTKNAWEAFTESQATHFPKVHDTCFRPEIASGLIINEESRAFVNVYVPVDIVMTEGDVTPFLTHLEMVLPDPRDREILISYMAACVQYKGVKFQWGPLLQGCEGNGKSLFTRILTHAIGHRYTHIAKSAGLGNKFNGWLKHKLLIIVEEIFTSNKRDTAEIMKEYITNDRLEMEGKGDNQVTGDNRANFFMCTNHKDAVAKNNKDRRYCIFYTAQQSPEDLIRCGWMTPSGDATSYFKELYDWLRHGGGCATVAHYLNTYNIVDSLNPATNCHRAPVTSSTDEVIRMSLGGIEQEILEAIDEKRLGFSGGWVSSMALDRLLDQRRDNKRITRNKRKELLTDLGYVPHPNLHKGRVNNTIPMDGGKPILYIKAGHILGNLQKPSEITARYIQDQSGEAVAEVAQGNVNT